MAAVAILASGSAIASLGTAHAATGNAVLKGSIPAWANSKNYAGPADPRAMSVSASISAGTILRGGGAGSAVSDPGSSSYRDYLTPAQFRQRFAPSQAQVGAVQSWLRRARVSASSTPRRTTITFPPKAPSPRPRRRSARRSASTTSRGSRFDRRSRMCRSLTRWPASCPASSAWTTAPSSCITDHTTGDARPPPAAFVNAQPCSAYWGQAQATGFTNPYGAGTCPTPLRVHPAQVKGAYGLSDGTTGPGRRWRSSTPTPRRPSPPT